MTQKQILRDPFSKSLVDEHLHRQSSIWGDADLLKATFMQYARPNNPIVIGGSGIGKYGLTSALARTHILMHPRQHGRKSMLTAMVDDVHTDTVKQHFIGDNDVHFAYPTTLDLIPIVKKLPTHTITGVKFSPERGEVIGEVTIPSVRSVLANSLNIDKPEPCWYGLQDYLTKTSSTLKK